MKVFQTRTLFSNFTSYLIQVRYHVRVRFAPSPTGYLHLGGMRTALYNFAFARSQGGKFILRIEDTDKSRLIPGAIERLQLDLEWLGISPDEGPLQGGPVGPYIQSERKELYMKEAQKLLDNGAAYKCFCSERRLELLRKEAQRKQEVPKYDNRCRLLSEKEIEKKLSSGTPFCVRFKLTKSETVNDVIYGEFVHEVEKLEGDPVILKTDGLPTYHFANVVDDHMMEITHVIRGVEWIQSVNKHLMLYRALGYEPPLFAHLPLLLNSDGSKMSKRQGDLTIESFRQRGILPRALINFVIRAGSGFQEIDNDICLSLQELSNRFKLDKINTNSSRVPMHRLGEFNRAEIVRQLGDREAIDILTEDLTRLVRRSFPYSEAELALDAEHIRDVLHWTAPRITTLNDLVGDSFLFLWSKPKLNIKTSESVILKNLLTKLSSATFKKETLGPLFKEFAKDSGLPYKNLMELMRSVLSGLKKGPGVVEMMEILGKNSSLHRIERAIEGSKEE